MYRSILVPVDRSQRAAGAVEAAFRLAAGGAGSHITLLHVVEIIKDTTYEDYRDFYDSLAAQAHSEMDELLAPFKESGARVDTEVAFGRRVKEILRVAEERGFDLIVLQSHRIDRDEPTRGWGTISHRVGILANCPVLLVK
jgi:nucleotide-binding universal stress UspA family protein